MQAKELLKVHYFAYGHNTNSEEFKSRCPSAEEIGTGVLKNFELIFKHFSDIKPSNSGKVVGVLWEITHSDLKNLDKDEGYHSHYNRIAVLVECNGKSVAATTYIMDPEYNEHTPPEKDYIKKVVTGYKEHDIPIAQIKQGLHNHPINNRS